MELTRDEIKEKVIKLIHNFITELQNAELDESSIINTDTKTFLYVSFKIIQLILQPYS